MAVSDFTDTPMGARVNTPANASEHPSLTDELLSFAETLSLRDVALLTKVVRKVAEIEKTKGEETALAVVDLILERLKRRPSN